MMKNVILALAIAAAALAGAPGRVLAQAVAPVMARDLPNVPGMTMTALTVTYAPGEASGSHHHAAQGFLIAYVLQGAIVSQVEGELEKTYTAGQSWAEGPGAHHLVSRNASATAPASLLVVFVAPKDAVLTTPDAPAAASR
jgi:quercetin dioxygenase-like cupin family protein